MYFLKTIPFIKATVWECSFPFINIYLFCFPKIQKIVADNSHKMCYTITIYSCA